MRKILFATDFASETAPAQTMAVTLARVLHARLELLHVVFVPPAATLDGMSANLVEDIRKSAEAELAQRAARIAAEGVDVGARVHVGVVDIRILEHAHALQADLIIVGTYGRKGAARLFVGSVAERAVHRAGCPVLVVPPVASSSSPRWAPGRPLRIVVGVDGSLASDAALSWLRRFKEELPCDVRLVHLYWPPREHERLGLGPCDPHQTNPEVALVLDRELRAHATAHLGGADIRLRLCPTWGAEENALAREAEAEEADLLLVGTNQARNGSTAVNALRGARVPVLCVPAKTLAPGELGAGEGPVREVLVTTDLSPLGNAAVAEAYRLVSSGGVVVLAHVALPSPPLGLTPDSRDEIEAKLMALIPRNVDAGRIHSRPLILESAHPGEAILQAILRFGPDVVVMSSHGRSGLGRLVRGSVTERVLRDSSKPVLVVPASAVAEANLQPSVTKARS